MSLLAFTLSEAADITSLSRDTLTGSISLGYGPKARTYGKRVIILKKDLEAWLDSLPESRLEHLREGFSEGRGS